MKLPLDDKYFRWTTHVKEKLLFYRLSPQIVKTVLKNPVRRETGIAPNTIAEITSIHILTSPCR